MRPVSGVSAAKAVTEPQSRSNEQEREGPVAGIKHGGLSLVSGRARVTALLAPSLRKIIEWAGQDLKLGHSQLDAMGVGCSPISRAASEPDRRARPTPVEPRVMARALFPSAIRRVHQFRLH